ncbi:hypothetical protein CHLNCDRAFT_137467 [Chlorella variabilis]|uniref:Alkaline phosphatase n=1 Tax=Chlorella variabilis TaxID=554065 RepID=E1ZMI0_CHLVA|nr:hypothetical protein CHLNCDRAFT_137467 [Chlorella variabilis]EFN53116.1 hypothetical protein CHLNCDRAFT_137467 [Chlorella variabilis]|eukprot:XP_005845218.1 hypothetical protein CHLNCDRAFT_137467 [Chlorella variabilis]
MAQPPPSGFLHGVASFDPSHEAVIIWTRWTPATTKVPQVVVEWEVAAMKDFSSLTASGTFETDASRDWTVAVDVTGLQPAKRYYYRFNVGKAQTVTGITKTLGTGRVEELRFATVSCCNWGFGFFHVYELVAKVDALDFVLHCGDYIYEARRQPPYEKYNYPAKQFQARHGLRPKHRLKELGDYRERYACYRTDPALQEMHRRVPMIAAWDDHEIADSAHVGGAEDFKGTQQEWDAQKVAAITAYVEWIPIRGMSHDSINLMGCHRTFSIGDLATIMLVENRISCRQPPVDMKETQFYKETAEKHPKQWDDDAILAAKADLMQQFRDPGRTMLGEVQLEDVKQAVAQSVANRQPWQILISQVIMAQLKAPKLKECAGLQPKLLAKLCSGALNLATDVAKSGKEGAELARMYLGMGKYGVPMNPDAGDGYQAERAKLFDALGQPGTNPVVLAGDSHNAWCSEIRDDDGKRLGVEFDAPAVTSIGAFEDIYSRFEEKAGKFAKLFPLWVFTPWIEDSLQCANPDTLKFALLDQRGFVLHHLTRACYHAEFHFVSTVQKKKYSHYCAAVFEAEAGKRGQLKKGVRYMTIDGAVPERERPRRSALLRSACDILPHKWGMP